MLLARVYKTKAQHFKWHFHCRLKTSFYLAFSKILDGQKCFYPWYNLCLLNVQLYRFKLWILNSTFYTTERYMRYGFLGNLWHFHSTSVFSQRNRLQAWGRLLSRLFIQCTEVQTAKGDRLLSIIRVWGPRFDHIDRAKHWHYRQLRKSFCVSKSIA